MKALASQAVSLSKREREGAGASPTSMARIGYGEGSAIHRSLGCEAATSGKGSGHRTSGRIAPDTSGPLALGPGSASQQIAGWWAYPWLSCAAPSSRSASGRCAGAIRTWKDHPKRTPGSGRQEHWPLNARVQRHHAQRRSVRSASVSAEIRERCKPPSLFTGRFATGAACRHDPFRPCVHARQRKSRGPCGPRLLRKV